MKSAVLLTLLVFGAGCAVRRPDYLVMPRGETRSEEPPVSAPPARGVQLPLNPPGRELLERFLDRDGRPGGPPVQESRERKQAHQKVLDALKDEANLTVRTTHANARTFCEAAPSLCSQTSLFQKKPFVRQIVDAREYKRPHPAPLAVSDGNYWWIFTVSAGERMTHVLLVRDVERRMEK